MKYPVIFERSKTGYGAYSPDVPGCITTGPTLEETRKLMKEALEFHFEGLAEDGLEIPKPTSHAEDIEVRLPVAHKLAS